MQSPCISFYLFSSVFSEALQSYLGWTGIDVGGHALILPTPFREASHSQWSGTLSTCIPFFVVEEEAKSPKPSKVLGLILDFSCYQLKKALENNPKK